MKLQDMLKILRTSKSLTQKQVASTLNINQYNLSDYETGRAEPDINTLIKLADLYEVSIDDMLSHNTNSTIKNSSTIAVEEYIKDLHTLKIIRRIQSLTDTEKDQLYNIIDSTCKSFFKK